MNLDPGALGADDQLQNLRAVREGRQVFSAYELRDGTRIWIITEADRSVTTILLPRGVLALEVCGGASFFAKVIASRVSDILEIA
jgi:hypothetical protein